MDTQNQVIQRQQTPMQRFNSAMSNVRTKDYLLSMLGSEKKRDQFVTSLVSVVSGNELLQKCDPMSVLYAAMKSVPINLPIEGNLGYAAVIPYGTNATFQIMRNGWMELAMRTGQVQFIANELVHEGELVKKNKFTGEYIFDEDSKKSDKVIGAMAYIKLINGFEKTVYMPVEEIKAHAARYSQTYKKGYGVWVDNFEAMALKTVLKKLIVKYCPKSAELQNAIVSDQQVTDGNNVSTYADNMPDEQPQNLSEKAMAKAKENVARAKAAAKPKESATEVSAEPEQAVEDDLPADGEITMFPEG